MPSVDLPLLTDPVRPLPVDLVSTPANTPVPGQKPGAFHKALQEAAPPPAPAKRETAEAKPSRRQQQSGETNTEAAAPAPGPRRTPSRKSDGPSPAATPAGNDAPPVDDTEVSGETTPPEQDTDTLPEGAALAAVAATVIEAATSNTPPPAPAPEVEPAVVEQKAVPVKSAPVPAPAWPGLQFHDQTPAASSDAATSEVADQQVSDELPTDVAEQTASPVGTAPLEIAARWRDQVRSTDKGTADAEFPIDHLPSEDTASEPNAPAPPPELFQSFTPTKRGTERQNDKPTDKGQAQQPPTAKPGAQPVVSVPTPPAATNPQPVAPSPQPRTVETVETVAATQPAVIEDSTEDDDVPMLVEDVEGESSTEEPPPAEPESTALPEAPRISSMSSTRFRNVERPEPVVVTPTRPVTVKVTPDPMAEVETDETVGLDTDTEDALTLDVTDTSSLTDVAEEDVDAPPVEAVEEGSETASRTAERPDADPVPGVAGPKVEPTRTTAASANGSVSHREAPRIIEHVAPQIAQGVEQSANVGQSVRVHLDPPDLGRLSIDVTVTQGMVSARLEAESAGTHRLLNENLPQLRDALAQQGVALDRLVVEHRGEGMRFDLGGRSNQQQGRDEGPARPEWMLDDREPAASGSRQTRSQRTPGRLDVQV